MARNTTVQEGTFEVMPASNGSLYLVLKGPPPPRQNLNFHAGPSLFYNTKKEQNWKWSGNISKIPSLLIDLKMAAKKVRLQSYRTRAKWPPSWIDHPLKKWISEIDPRPVCCPIHDFMLVLDELAEETDRYLGSFIEIGCGFVCVFAVWKFKIWS